MLCKYILVTREILKSYNWKCITLALETDYCKMRLRSRITMPGHWRPPTSVTCVDHYNINDCTKKKRNLVTAYYMWMLFTGHTFTVPCWSNVLYHMLPRYRAATWRTAVLRRWRRDVSRDVTAHGSCHGICRPRACVVPPSGVRPRRDFEVPSPKQSFKRYRDQQSKNDKIEVYNMCMRQFRYLDEIHTYLNILEGLLKYYKLSSVWYIKWFDIFEKRNKTLKLLSVDN